MSSFRTSAEWLLAYAWSDPLLSRVTGRLADLRLPRVLLVPMIRGYARLFGVDLAESAQAPEAFASFNAFFTRALAEGRRPIAGGAGVVIAPCDARLSVIGRVPEDGRLEQIKGSAYSLAALLGSQDEAEPFRGGTHATLYLSPAMYHRVHAPVDGWIDAWRYVPGRLFPVNGAGVRSIPGLFTRNERVCVFGRSAAQARVAVVLVGAANVGRVGLAFTDLVTNRGQVAGRFEASSPLPVRRGEEVGVFNLGSTVVVLHEDPRLDPLVEPGAVVRMGQALWRAS